MAREMYLVGVSEEELRPDPKPEGPKDFKGKWSNFWYHYKWTVIIVSFIVIAFAIMLFQFLSKNDPDYTLVLVTQKPAISSSQPTVDIVADKLASEFQKYGRDIDGDGKVEVQVESLYVDDGTQTSVINKQKLLAHISAGDAMLFIFDSPSYQDNISVLENQADTKFFSPLDVQSKDIDKNENYWNWKNDPLRQDPDLSGLPDNLYFGVRDISQTANSKSSIKLHDECIELLEAYIKKEPLTASNS